MSIPLYFDTVTNEGKYAETFSGEKILYNLNKIDEGKFNHYADVLSEAGKATMFLHGGRYVILVSASLELRGKVMKIYDFLDNEQFSLKMFDGDRFINEIMFEFYECRKNYKVDYNKFIPIQSGLPNEVS